MTDTQQESNARRVGKWGPREPQNSKSNHPWAAVRRRYEWNDSYEDGIAPRDEELEKELFGEENHVHTGINFSRYENIKVHLKGSEIKPISTFNEGNLHPVMKENIVLTRYTTPTPVQKWSIPVITEGHDLMACAQTGSGKTAAFLVPILSKLFGKAKKLAAPRPQPGSRRYKAQPLVLILAPTRELATQIFDECRRFTYRSMLRPCVVYGGADSNPQKAEISKGCDVLTATPGRLCDFLERGLVSLQRVKFLVLDEADRMLDMGFETSIRKIVEKSDLLSDGSRQTLMFSATFPKTIRKLAKDFLQEQYLFLTVGRVGGTTSDITQKIVYVEDEDKRTYLVKLLLQQPPSRTLIFVDTKRGADSLDDFLYNQNFPTTSIHGDRTQREREDALIAFKNGRSPILIATAVAARGLDIKNVMHVINYDLCSEIDEYVHRIGRTARVGNKGLATTFYNEHSSQIASELVKILVECNQEVPDFLKGYITDNISFDEDYDDDDTPSNDAPSRGNFNKPNNQGNSWENQTKHTDTTSSWGGANEEKQWGGGANEEKQWGGAREEKQWDGQPSWGGGANEEKQWDGKAPWDAQPQQQVAQGSSLNANAPSFTQQNYMMQNNQQPPYQQQNYQQQHYQQQPPPPTQFQQPSVGGYPPPPIQQQGVAPSPPTYAPHQFPPQTSQQPYSAVPPPAQYGAPQNPTPGPNYNMPPQPQQNYGYNPQPIYNNDNSNGYDGQNNGNQNNGNGFKENSNRSLDSPGRKSNGSPNGLPKHQKNRSQNKRNGRSNNNNNNKSNDEWGAPGQDNTWQ